ncbi:MAG: hypothetical protein GY809_14755 [Planctomycetes bacterium]|nr:hypothetical protein [Planctomycetota bacterium]
MNQALKCVILPSMSDEPKQVQVKRVLPPTGPVKPGFWQRYHRVVFPIVGGIILDCADLATYGPAGLYTGMIVGCTLGWLISDFYEYSKKGRVVFAILAGVYCTTPGTFLLPLATLSAVLGWQHGSGPRSRRRQRKAR